MVLVDDVLTFKEGCVSASINVLNNDSLKDVADYSTLSLLPFTDDFLWRLDASGNLSVNYFPETIFEQELLIKYRLCDTLLNCDTAEVLVKVLKNDPPTTKTFYQSSSKMIQKR